MNPKGFLVKIYNREGDTLLRTVTNLKAEPSFGMEREKGVKDTNLSFAESFDTIPAHLGVAHLVRIYVSTEDVPEGILVYTGYISELEGILSNTEQIKASVWGLSALMARGFFKQGSSFDVAFEDMDIADIFKEVIDHFNTIYPDLISYTDTSIETTGVTMTYDFQKLTWLGVLEQVFKFTDPDWTWYVNGDGVVYLKQISVTADHELVMGKHITAMNIKKTLYTVINSCTVFYNGGNTTVSNAGSISAYGLAEKVIEDNGITDLTLAQQRASFEVLNNKDPLFTGSISVNQGYDIESIKVGDTVRVKNIAEDSLLGDTICTVASIQYSLTGVTLELTRTRSNFQRFLNSLFSYDQVG